MIPLFYTHILKNYLQNKSFKGSRYFFQILKLFSPKMEDGMIIKTKHGFRMEISPVYDKGIERALYNKGVYEEGTLWCLNKMITKGTNIMDIGANIGLITVFAGRRTGPSGKVYAFEPFPSTFKILQKNIKLNKLLNIYSFNIALGSERRKGRMFQNIHINRGAASFYTNFDIESYPVDVEGLDKFLEKNTIDKIDIVKIDIEGSEIPMLIGAKNFLKNQRPMICIEFSRDVNGEYDPGFLFELLIDDYKYKIFKQRDGKETKTPLMPVKHKNDLPQHDNLFCFLEEHLENIPKDLFYSDIV